MSATPAPESAERHTSIPPTERCWDETLDMALAATFPASDPVAANRFD
jgi:hypothetical protein